MTPYMRSESSEVEVLRWGSVTQGSMTHRLAALSEAVGEDVSWPQTATRHLLLLRRGTGLGTSSS